MSLLLVQVRLTMSCRPLQSSGRKRPDQPLLYADALIVTTTFVGRAGERSWGETDTRGLLAAGRGSVCAKKGVVDSILSNELHNHEEHFGKSPSVADVVLLEENHMIVCLLWGEAEERRESTESLVQVQV